MVYVLGGRWTDVVSRPTNKMNVRKSSSVPLKINISMINN
jgi:hypothetical protein